MITRRAFIGALAGGVLAAPVAVEGQQAGKVPRIGVLLPGNSARAAGNPRMQAFYQALRDLGWVDGQNVAFERRYAEDQSDRLTDLAIGLGSSAQIVPSSSALRRIVAHCSARCRRGPLL